MVSSADSFGLTVWLFGSVLRTRNPQDLDVLVVYQRRKDLESLRENLASIDSEPHLHLIAMTPDEEDEYRFCATTGAVLLFSETIRDLRHFLSWEDDSSLATARSSRLLHQ